MIMWQILGIYSNGGEKCRINYLFIKAMCAMRGLYAVRSKVMVILFAVQVSGRVLHKRLSVRRASVSVARLAVCVRVRGEIRTYK